eukprot:TRINITY_DN1509_c0_g1_i5.p1 TRINITY_DN1509_c0_g1~~TRINITY_DN1509_c0_g1_i5.p1  ORF type:complete len:749 (+),score=238.95 TRINITY_DN1509_c0_g1_i5:372-2618(+)
MPPPEPAAAPLTLAAGHNDEEGSSEEEELEEEEASDGEVKREGGSGVVMLEEEESDLEDVQVESESESPGEGEEEKNTVESEAVAQKVQEDGEMEEAEEITEESEQDVDDAKQAADEPTEGSEIEEESAEEPRGAPPQATPRGKQSPWLRESVGSDAKRATPVKKAAAVKGMPYKWKAAPATAEKKTTATNRSPGMGSLSAHSTDSSSSNRSSRRSIDELLQDMHRALYSADDSSSVADDGSSNAEAEVEGGRQSVYNKIRQLEQDLQNEQALAEQLRRGNTEMGKLLQDREKLAKELHKELTAELRRGESLADFVTVKTAKEEAEETKRREAHATLDDAVSSLKALAMSGSDEYDDSNSGVSSADEAVKQRAAGAEMNVVKQPGLPPEFYHRLVQLENLILGTYRGMQALKKSKATLDGILASNEADHGTTVKKIENKIFEISLGKDSPIHLEAEILELQSHLQSAQEENRLLNVIQQAKVEAISKLRQDLETRKLQDAHLNNLKAEAAKKDQLLAEVAEENARLLSGVDQLEQQLVLYRSRSKHGSLSYEKWNRERLLIQSRVKRIRETKKQVELAITKQTETAAKLQTKLRALPTALPDACSAPYESSGVSGSNTVTLPDLDIPVKLYQVLKTNARSVQTAIASKEQAIAEKNEALELLAKKLTSLEMQTKRDAVAEKKEAQARAAQKSTLQQKLMFIEEECRVRCGLQANKLLACFFLRRCFALPDTTTTRRSESSDCARRSPP